MDKNRKVDKIIISKEELNKLDIDILLKGKSSEFAPVSISELKEEYILRPFLDGFVPLEELMIESSDEAKKLGGKVAMALEKIDSSLLDFSRVKFSTKTVYYSKKEEKIAVVFNNFATQLETEMVMKTRCLMILREMENQSIGEAKALFKKVRISTEVFDMGVLGIKSTFLSEYEKLKK